MENNETKSNDEKKALIEKIKDRIEKDNKRAKIRKENMNKFKKYEMMDFEKTKFEIIQKSSKKFQKITEETKKELLEDISKYNFSKIMEEIIKNILEAKIEFKDVNALILICSELNQIYEKFDVKYLEMLNKQMSESYAEMAKPSKNEDEEERKLQRRKVLSRLFIESYLYGLISDFTLIRDLFVKLINPKNAKEQFYLEFPVLVHLMKVFAEPLFGVKSKTVQSLISAGDIEDYELNLIQSKTVNEKYYSGFKDFYFKKVLALLEEEHKTLVELEKKNFENMKKLDSHNEISQSYLKQRNFYLRFIGMINEFAEVMNFEIPELANEKTFRYEEQKKSEMKLEKINRYDPFSDEIEYLFYNQLIPPLQEIATPDDDDDQASTEINEEKYKKFDQIVSKVIKCESQETIDEISVDFLKNSIFSSYKYRKAFLKSILRSSKSNLAVLRYFARVIANVSSTYKDMPTECCQMLMEDFLDLNNEDKLGMLEEKIKNVRFISEMIKFELFPMHNVFEILKKLVDDFKGHSIDLLCQIMEHSGRFLYLNETSHLKFSNFLENVKQLAHHRLRHDERAFNSIINSITICKPQDNAIRKKVKVRTVEEEYLRFLMYQLLNKASIKKIAVLLRRMDWTMNENLIFKVVFKYLSRGNENQIKWMSSVLSLIKDYHPMLIFNLINAILEEIRIGLERNDFNDNQRKILMCLLLANFYSYKLVSSDTIFYALYMILTYNPEWNTGRREVIADNPLDLPSDTFRILMVITVLDICGCNFTTKGKKERLDEFLHFLQVYILTKQYLPLDVENRVTNCLDHLYSADEYHLYNDFNDALKDSKKYKGLQFDADESDLHKQEEANVKDEQVIDSNESDKKVAMKIEDDADFKRDKEKDTTPVINIDEEIQKIIAESLFKAKGTSSNTVINPLADVKKKDMNKIKDSSSKMKLITKQSNKITVKEIDKNIIHLDK